MKIALAIAAALVGLVLLNLLVKRLRIRRNRAAWPDFRIRQVPNFLTPEECDHVIAKAGPLMQASQVDTVGKKRGSIMRGGKAGCVEGGDDPTIQRIKEKVAGLVGSPVSHHEPLQVIWYDSYDFYATHFDAGANQANEPGGLREWTVLTYLNDGYTGGATSFPLIGETVQPERGKAVVFKNLTEDGRIHPMSLHTGSVVFGGEKWIVNQWVRRGPREE